MIGAVGGLVLTGAAFVLGRKRLQQSVKEVSLPGAALKVILWRGRYERLVAEGRTRCEESIRQSLAVPMDQLSSVIAEHLWSRLRMLVGEGQRPGVGQQGEPR